uniref:Cystatin-B n=1 Tax=Sander lucioperca TaxID=283035 RepID=A0A8C9X816_SANLU
DTIAKMSQYGQTADATQEVKDLCHQVKPQVQDITGKSYVDFTVFLYRSEVVAGTNYLIKVHVGGDDYIHLIIFRGLPCYGGKVSLTKVKDHQTKDSPLQPF